MFKLTERSNPMLIYEFYVNNTNKEIDNKNSWMPVFISIISINSYIGIGLIYSCISINIKNTDPENSGVIMIF